jgi:error-prone DNA polymerase
VQHASGVTHLIVEQATDLSGELRRVSGIDGGLPLNAGRGDDAKRSGSGEDSRDPTPILRPRDMYEPDTHIDTLKVRARDFR